MNGSEHYRVGERLLSDASFLTLAGRPVKRDGEAFASGEHEALIARAMAHFAAAQAAATALRAVLPLIGGDCAEVTEWARAVGALDGDARQGDVVEAVIHPACWPPVPGDAWSLKPGGSWLTYTYMAQDTPDGMRMIPARIGTDTDDALSPDELLKQGELKLLYRNPEEPPF